LWEKVRAIAENPQYISRKDEILLLQARIGQLLEKISLDDDGGAVGWSLVSDALIALEKGNTSGARELLDDAVKQHVTEKEVWKEIYTTMDMLKNMTNTQMKTAKELRTMVSMEQLNYMLLAIQQIIMDLAKEHITDDRTRNKFLNDFGSRIAERFTDARYASAG
jgi:hypothetical protein